MMSVYKKFDKKLHAENDKIARNVVKSFFNNRFSKDGVTIIDNPNKYGVDLWMMRNGNIIANLEAEVKIVWKGHRFPFPNIQFPTRKKKFAGLGKPTMYCMLNEDKSRLLTVWDKYFTDDKIVEVPNKYVPQGEMFYQIPLDKAVFYDINEEK